MLDFDYFPSKSTAIEFNKHNKLLLLISLGGIVIYAIILLMLKYGSSITGQILKELIKDQSNNTYSLNYREIEVSPLDLKIEARDLMIQKLSTEDDSLKYTYLINIPYTEISILSFWDIYFQNSLQFTGIKVYDPQVQISKNENKGEKSTLSFETGSLYKTISSYLFLLKIDSLVADNAAVEFNKISDTDPFSLVISQINLDIENFQIDSLSSNDRFLLTDRIELVITNQSFLLNDGLNEISFDELSISTRSKDLLFKNLQFKNINQGTSDEYDFELKIPELNFRGIDFEEAYKKNYLNLDSIRIRNPVVHFSYHGLNKPPTDTKKSISLSSIFPTIDIEKLYLDNAYLSVDYEKNGSFISLIGQKVNAEIFSLKLDSTVNNTSLDNFYKALNLSVNQLYSVYDSTYVLKIDQLNYSTTDPYLSLKDIELSPIGSKSQSLKLFKSQGVLIKGFENQFWKQDSIRLPVLYLSRPELDIKLRKNKKPFPLPFIKIDDFRIDDGDIKLDAQNFNLISQHSSLAFSYFTISSDIIKRHQPKQLARKSTVNLGKTHVTTSQLEMNMSRLYCKDFKNFLLSDFSVDNNGNRPFSVEQLELFGVDLPELLDKSHIAFDSLNLNNPTIQISNSGTNNLELSTLLKHAKFIKATISNGKLDKWTNKIKDFYLKDFNLNLQRFSYDSLTNDFNFSVGFKADSIYGYLPIINHEFAAKDFHISDKDSTIYARIFTLAPTASNLSNTFRFASNGIRLHQIDLKKLINEQQLHFYNGYVISPTIKFSINDNGSLGKNVLDNFLKFTSLNISNADLSLTFSASDNSTQVVAKKLNLLVSGFDQSNDSLFLYAKNYLTDAQDISLKLPKQGEIKFTKGSFNTASGLLRLKGIQYEKKDNLAFFMPEVVMKGLNSESLGKYNLLESDSVIFYRPSIKFGVPETSSDSMLVNFSFDFKYFKIIDGTFSLLLPELNQGDSLNFQNINFGLGAIHLRSGESIKSLAPLMDSASLSLGTFQYSLSSGLYRFGLDRLQYIGSTSTLRLEGLSFKPMYNRREFQTHIPNQKERFDLNIPSLQVENLSLWKLLNDEGFSSTKIEITSMNLDTHRDKRLPLPPFEEKLHPQSLLKEIPMIIDVDTLKLSNAYISHSEFSASGSKPGSIFFKNINATVTNITNDSTQIALNNRMNFISSGTMMNTGNFNVSGAFKLNEVDDPYVMAGTVGNMDLTELNRLLENTAHVSVKSGLNKLITFSIQANTTYAIGEMKFYYDDLKISVLKSDIDQSEASGIKSFFANTFVVSKRNPHFLVVRTGDIFFERDPSKSIFNYWAKSLLSGVVSSIGAQNNKKEIKKFYKLQKEALDQEKLAISDSENVK